jgi:asparagine synthase (glutamine-hydrolysing)
VSAIAAVARARDPRSSSTLAEAMVRTSTPHASAITVTLVDEATPVALAAGAAEWEGALRPGAGSIAANETTHVAADASLYHREDLQRALGVAEGLAPSDARLILAAYARWGPEAFARLEGDFAVVLWDASRARLVAARSFTGHRSLFHARVGDGLRIATRVAGLLHDPDLPRDLDLGAIATVAAGLWNHAPATAYRAITELPPGHLLVWDAAQGVRVSRFWHPPMEMITHRVPLDAAAEELRALLVAAVRERLAPSGATALSLSGGWDSTSVGAAATVALAGDDSRRLVPVSISYPVGDPGREDELIGETLAAWGIAPTWIPVDDIALVRDPLREAGVRDLPFAHAFEHWNRALGRTGASAGARVLLDGVGGDQLFQVSDILLADLFSAGRWVELAHQWRVRGGSGIGDLWSWVIRPALPERVVRVLAALRGHRAGGGHLDRRPSWWIADEVLESSGAFAREAAHSPPLPHGSRVRAETHAYLSFPFFGRVLGSLRDFALEEGVELRSPLLDDRIVRFAAQRPWSERSDGRETKILLRRAVRGLVPAPVLAPRPHRTGVTSAYFLRQLRTTARPFVEAALDDPLLATMGLIDGKRLRSAWAHVMRSDDDDLGARVLFTVQAEWWTRAHSTMGNA